jgi:hypothetical protein
MTIRISDAEDGSKDFMRIAAKDARLQTLWDAQWKSYSSLFGV